MSDFTWKRGRAGLSSASATDTILANQLGQYAPGAATTVRRVIVDWGIDLFAVDRTGQVNSNCPITLALYAGQSDTDTPTPPDFGPNDNPDLGWWWWQGAWFSNPYISPTEGEENGVFSANGRIDMKISHDLIDSLYTTLWLVSEILDVDAGWTTFKQIAWWQQLSAPTGT